MPEREKQIIDAISNVVGNMKKEDKVYILGYVEGMAAVKGTEPGDEENQEEVLV